MNGTQVGVRRRAALTTEYFFALGVGQVVWCFNVPEKSVWLNTQGRLFVVFVKNPNDGANVYGIERFDGEGEVAGSAIELTHVVLLFGDIALIAGVAIWTNSPRSFMASQTMKKNLLLRR